MSWSPRALHTHLIIIMCCVQGVASGSQTNLSTSGAADAKDDSGKPAWMRKREEKLKEAEKEADNRSSVHKDEPVFFCFWGSFLSGAMVLLVQYYRCRPFALLREQRPFRVLSYILASNCKLLFQGA